MWRVSVLPIFFEQSTKVEIENSTDPKIINLSTSILSKSEESVLKYGMKFCPTPENITFAQEDADTEDFCRKIKREEYFHEVTADDLSIVKPKSNFMPPSGRN